MPQVFNRIRIWWFRRGAPPVYPFSCKPFLSTPRCMFGIIILRESVVMRIHGLNERYQMIIQNLTVSSVSIMPSNMQAFVAPLQLMPAHTCTLVGCFGRGLYLGFCPRLRQQNRLCVSICTEVSSVHMTSWKSSPRFSCAQWSLLTRFGARISWQYAVPRCVHPSKRRPLSAVDKEVNTPAWCIYIYIYIYMYILQPGVT